MPSALTYPGVYIEEIPSGVRTITGVATSITAFIGRALRGPVDKATTINSFGDFERMFGGIWSGSSLGFAVRDFYLNGGKQAIIVRLFTPTFATEAERQTALKDSTAQAQTAADAVAKAAADAAAVAAPPATPQSVAAAAAGAAAGASTPGPSAKFAANAVAKAAADAAAVAAPPPTPQSVATAAKNAVAATVSAAANVAAPLTKAQLSVGGLKLEAAYEGKWGNYLRARIDKDISDEVATRLNLDKADLFNLTVRDTKAGIPDYWSSSDTNGSMPETTVGSAASTQ